MPIVNHGLNLKFNIKLVFSIKVRQTSITKYLVRNKVLEKLSLMFRLVQGRKNKTLQPVTDERK
jgi:hypothetical protein